MIRVTGKNLISVIYSHVDGSYTAVVKHGNRYYQREYKRNAPKCVVNMVKTTIAARSITLNGEVLSELHGDTSWL